MSSGFQLAMLAPSSFAIISPATCRSLLPAGKSSAAAWHSLNAAWMSLAWRTTRDGAAARCCGANLCAIQPVRRVRAGVASWRTVMIHGREAPRVDLCTVQNAAAC